MKIMFLTRALTVGGAQRQLITLANGLVDKGYIVTVALFYSGGDMTDALDSRVQIVGLDKRSRWDLLSFVFKLRSLIHSFEPDVLYSFLESANILSVTMKLFAPGLKVVWGKRSAHLNLDDYGLIARPLFFIERILVRFADHILFNSMLAKDLYIEQGFPQDKSSVVLNGFAPQEFMIDDVGRNKIRTEFEITPDQYLIGIVGRIAPIKDHYTFLQVAARIKKNDVFFKFVIVGTGETAYLDELQTLSDELGLDTTVLWAGGRENMSAVYSALDLLVSASRGESFSNVIGEAMLCGTPCVVTNVGASAQVVSGFGKVVEPGSVEGIVSAILVMKDEVVDFDREQIRQHILDKYSVEQLVSQTVSVLVHVIGH